MSVTLACRHEDEDGPGMGTGDTPAQAAGPWMLLSRLGSVQGPSHRHLAVPGPLPVCAHASPGVVPVAAWCIPPHHQDDGHPWLGHCASDLTQTGTSLF